MALTHSTNSIVTDGLILCLDAANPKSYPGSGTTWTDLSPSKYNGTLTNSPTYSSSNGGVFTFNGSNTYVNVALPSTTSYNTFTYNIWAYATNTTGWRTLIDQNNDTWFFGVFGGELHSYNPQINTGYTISLNTWYNLTLAHTFGSPLRFYVNGSLVYTSANNSTSNTVSSFNIAAGVFGVAGGPPNEVWTGSIAQVSIYNRELSSTEISQNFNALRGRFGI